MRCWGPGRTDGDGWPGEGAAASTQLREGEVSGVPGVPGVPAECGAGNWGVALCPAEARAPCSSRTRLRRPRSSRISRSSWSTSGAGASRRAQVGAALPAETCGPAKVAALGMEVASGPDADHRGSREGGGLFPGAQAAACGRGAAVGASGAGPANSERRLEVVPPQRGDGPRCGAETWLRRGRAPSQSGWAPPGGDSHSPRPGSCSHALRFRTLREAVAASHQCDSSSSASGSGTVYSAAGPKRRTARLYL